MRSRPMQLSGLLFPSAPEIMARYLQAMMPPGFRISTDLTDWQRPQESLHLHLRGGESRGVLKLARVQMDVRCNTHDKTYDVTDLALSFLAELPLREPAVTRTQVYTEPQAVPDADQKPRLMTVIDVICRGAPRPATM